MQLPAEVRLMVLRYLLVRGTPIASRELYSHPYSVHNKGRERDGRGRFVKQTRKATVSGYHFTPSIIRTCQQLSGEALHVLYHCNTLQVHISMDALYRYSHMAEPLRSDGILDTQHFASRIQIHNGVFFPYRSGERWILNEDFNKTANQFKSFMIKVEISNPCPLALAHLRGSLKVIAQSLFIKEVKVTIVQHPGNSRARTPKQLFQLTKAFEVVRCSDFQFISLSDPTAISVQNIITSNTPVVDLEEFMRRPGELVRKTMANPGSGPAKLNKCRELKARLIDSIGDIDVGSFLQVRLEILRMWRSFMEKVEKFKLKVNLNGGGGINDGGEEFEYYFHSVANFNFEMHIYDSAELGLEVYEDGEKMNAKLRDLARLHNFSPIVDADTSD